MKNVDVRMLLAILLIPFALFSCCPHQAALNLPNSDIQNAKSQIAPLTELTLRKSESHEFAFESMNYEGKKIILPQIGVYLETSPFQLEPNQHFTVELFSCDFAEAPFETIKSPFLSRSMVSSAYHNAWQNRKGALRLTVTSGTITFTSLRIWVYTGSDSYYLILVSPKIEFDSDPRVKK